MLLKKLGWWDDLTDAEKRGRRRQELEDRSLRRHPARRPEARLPSVRQREGARDGVELPRPGSAAPRAALLAPPRPGRQVPDARRQEGVLAPADALQDACRRRTRTSSKKFPLILTSGRLVEYEGGGEETRSNPWLAELQQENFVEINPATANDRGIRDGEIRLGQVADRRADQGEGAGHRARRPRHRLHAVPFLGLVAGRGPAPVLPGGRRSRSCAARPSTRRRPTATTA